MKPHKKTASIKGFPAWGWVLLATVLVALAARVLLTKPASDAASLPSEGSVAEAAQMRQAGAFILDVREPEEWAQAHIPGAVLIPLGELPARLDEVPQDVEVVVVCRSGNRSAQGRDALLNAGFTRVTSMRGGMVQWQAKGLETVSGE